MKSRDAHKLIYSLLGQYFKPPEDLTISEWSAKNVFMPSGTSARPGKWQTTSYQEGVFEALLDDSVQIVTLMWGAQLGKTAILNNTIGYFIAHQPESQIMMQPSNADLKKWLVSKFEPMISYSNAVNQSLAKPRSRDGVNSQTMKTYKGGTLTFAWSGSPTTQKGISAPKIYCDEVDGYERNNEGHPVNLLSQRSASFGRKRKMLITSTPTLKGASFVEMSYESGDRREFFVPCIYCGYEQTLKWKNVKWLKGEDGDHDLETVKYFCENCGVGLSDIEKRKMVEAGKWIAQNKFNGHASFHLNELYSPFRLMKDIARSFLDKKKTNDIRSFVNMSLAETFEDRGERVESHELLNRVEQYDVMPKNCFVITAGIDVQLDRIEVQSIGWGVGEESFVLDYQIFYGNTDENDVWNKLSRYLDTKKFTYCDGRKFGITMSALDTGGTGNMTSKAYDYIRSRRKRANPYAIKGSSNIHAPLYVRPSLIKAPNKRNIELYSIGTSEAKTIIYQRLKKKEKRGDFVIHFKKGLCDEVYFNQLTAEEKKIRWVKGYPKVEWKNIAKDKRNEALDTFVYALVALRIANINLYQIYEDLIKKKEVKK
ncbi:phage terminase large subunit family protein [Francisella sp. SYW-9]|uniref:phage terminase large subunit family protein n=1 Tax=Francisella sp. SYW-9 TaxID=2610888 RepID=UPI00123D79A0|nr:terminase gpA endonuclease subunit [Francisella sp. SYW-9]